MTNIERIERRIADLYANDPQFRNAKPIAEVIEAASQPDLRLAEILQTLVDGYADRPALGHRARELVTDTTTGRTSMRLLPRFDTISYRELWDRVGAIATALRERLDRPGEPGRLRRHDRLRQPRLPDGRPGDAPTSAWCRCRCSTTRRSPNSGRSSPRPSPRSSRSAPSTSTSPSSRRSKAHRCAGLWFSTTSPPSTTNAKASSGPQARLTDAGLAVAVDTLADVVEHGRSCRREPAYTGGSRRPARDDHVHLGQHRGAQGRHVSPSRSRPAVDRGFAPPTGDAGVQRQLHAAQPRRWAAAHRVGLPGAAAQAISCPKSDLSTLFDDWTLVRPTDSRWCRASVDMLFQRYRSAVDRLVADGADRRRRRGGRRGRAAR